MIKHHFVGNFFFKFFIDFSIITLYQPDSMTSKFYVQKIIWNFIVPRTCKCWFSLSIENTVIVYSLYNNITQRFSILIIWNWNRPFSQYQHILKQLMTFFNTTVVIWMLHVDILSGGILSVILCLCLFTENRN